DIDALFRQRTEHQAGDTHVAAHAYAYDGYLADLVVGDDFAGAHCGADLVLQKIQRTGEVVAVDRERKVGRSLHRLILQNHVDVNVGRGDRTQNRIGNPWGVGYG